MIVCSSKTKKSNNDSYFLPNYFRIGYRFQNVSFFNKDFIYIKEHVHFQNNPNKSQKKPFVITPIKKYFKSGTCVRSDVFTLCGKPKICFSCADAQFSVFHSHALYRFSWSAFETSVLRDTSSSKNNKRARNTFLLIKLITRVPYTISEQNGWTRICCIVNPLKRIQVCEG